MCLKPRQSLDNLDRDITYNTYNEELDQCDYVDYNDAIEVNENDLAILQLNIRGLYGKLSQLKALLNDTTCGKNQISYCYVRPGKIKVAQYHPCQGMTMCLKLELIS